MRVYVVWILLFTITSYSKTCSVRLFRTHSTATDSWQLRGDRYIKSVSRTEILSTVIPYCKRGNGQCYSKGIYDWTSTE